jgi:hypothetical protein
VRQQLPEPPPELGVRTAEPREWERLWARVIAEASVKDVGFALKVWADYRTGADIRPGYEILMRVTGIDSRSTVSDALKLITGWGFIWKYKEGNRRQRESDEYRLTLPLVISGIPLLCPKWERPEECTCG